MAGLALPGSRLIPYPSPVSPCPAHSCSALGGWGLKGCNMQAWGCLVPCYSWMCDPYVDVFNTEPLTQGSHSAF